VEGEWLQLNREAGVWADVWQLEEAFSEIRGVQGAGVNEAQVQRLRRGVDLYRADLLEGWYSDWCHYERERLKTVYLAALDKLLAYCEAHGLFEEGLLYGERILAHDRAHERTHRRMMHLHQLAGDRTRALRQFDRCAVALREELAMEPSHSMLALREQIRGDRLAALEPH
jgi:two-component SAPR family response regulator